MTGRLLVPEQLAERWQVPVSQIYRLTREDKIPTVRVGRYYRYSVPAIERFEAGDTHGGQGAA
ncbi:MAG: helix-turn-helix domain-containing protein [Gemmatimonadaceae bacterium]|nr:helix-turn-helix domain-containing protein [Gemmatimonadaceae bacterium]